MNSATKPQPRSIDQVRALAGDLIRELAEHTGDSAAVSNTLGRWLDLLGEDAYSLVSMAAVRAVFGDCLIPHPSADAMGALTLDLSRTDNHRSK